ncbi:pheromone B alpha 1 receptor [Lyophyllum atratum]|nr:pheromone B alpha 1 receptor [Lyophyllum atratum]
MSIPNEVITAFSFLGFILCCIPFPWHLEAWNTGTCLYMAWAGLACLNQAINSVIWNGNAINWAPVWCDISARFLVGVAVAIPAASLCINRRLYHIASVRSVTVTKAEKRRAIMVDLAIGLGLPILEMILQYIPQGHRFNIFGDVGCFPFTYNTPVGIALVSVPPVLIGCVSAVYSILSIRAFARSRAQFKELLSGQSNLSTNRYLRLMMLAGIETALTIPLGILAIVENCTVGYVSPWKGWADTHWGFSRVDQIPSILWRSNPELERSLEMTRFFIIICALVFFGFFGFAEEARKNYRSAVQSVAKVVGVSTGSSSFGIFSSTGSKSKGTNMSSTGRGATLPVFVERHTLRKHDSLDSFSDMSASFADVGGILDEKTEKPETLSRQLSYDGLVLDVASGTLADYQDGPYSPTPSSGASSASSIAELSPTTPEAAVTRPDSSCIEISSVRHLQVGECADALTIPEPTHYGSPRHASDASPV